MPQPSDRRLFLVAPGKVAVLAVKLLGNNFHRTKHAHERGRHEFSGHLWIFNIGRAALRTTNQSGGDVGVGGLPLDHLLLAFSNSASSTITFAFACGRDMKPTCW